jgi:branched-chain amino acid transport system permease protein
MGQILLYAVGSAVSLSLFFIILALVLRGPYNEPDMLQRTLIILPQVLLDGLTRGFIFAAIALGYTMVYGVLEFINFAHGEIFMVGGFVTAGFGTVLNHYGLLETFSPVFFVLIVIALGMLTSGVLAVIMERVAYRPIRLRNAPRLVALITAVGMSLFLQDLVRMVATTSGLGFNAPVEYPGLGKAIQVKIPLSADTIAFMSMRMEAIILIISAIIMLIGLNYLVNVTKLGKAIRAVSQDRATASLMGINVNQVIVFTFLIGGALGGGAGALFGIFVGTINPYAGFIPGLKAFTAAVLGGIGNITGAVVGGIVLGFLESFVASYLSMFTQGNFTGANYADIAAFSILIIILIFRPSGILGETTVHKV